jgi:hypothetical protein
VVAANALANLRRPAPYRRRRQFTLGRTFTALSRQLQGQTQGRKILLRPAIFGQVVDDA